MGDEDHRRAGLGPDAEQLDVQSLPRHLVEGTEGLVHEQERGRERQRARDGNPLLHPAGELPRIVLLESAELDQLDHLLDAPRAPGAVPAEQLERERDVPRDGPPVVEDSGLEDDPVVAIETCAMGRLSVDEDLAARGLHEIADDAEQRRLPTPRGTDEGDELPTADFELDVLERGDAALAERLRDIASGDDDIGHTSSSGA